MHFNKTGEWNGKKVKYANGRLIIAKKLNDSDDYCSSLIRSFNCRVLENNSPGIFEISVIPEKTIATALAMQDSKLFRFVELNKEGY